MNLALAIVGGVLIAMGSDVYNSVGAMQDDFFPGLAMILVGGFILGILAEKANRADKRQ